MKFALAFLLAGTAAAFTPAAPAKESTALNVARTKKVTGEVKKNEIKYQFLDTVVFTGTHFSSLSFNSLRMVFQDPSLPSKTLILLDLARKRTKPLSDVIANVKLCMDALPKWHSSALSCRKS